MSDEGPDPSVASLLATVERLRVREARLAALYATANDLTAILDVQEVLAAIVRRARQLLGTDIAYVGLVDDAGEQIDIRVVDGAVSAAFMDLRMPLGTGLLGLVASSGQPWATSDYHADERFRHRGYIDDAVGDERVRAILGVPMTVAGRTVGALLTSNRSPRPFPTEEVELLSSFAAHAAIALENARLFSAVQEAGDRLAAHSDAMERAARAHDRLSAALVGDGGVDAVVGVLADDLGAGVEVVDAEGRVLARRGDLADAAPDDLGRARLGAEAAASGRSVETGSLPAVHAYLAAAAPGGDLLATVVAVRADELEPAERRTLDRAALGVAVLLSFERSVALADGRAREDLLAEVVAGRADAPGTRALLQREGVDVAGPHVAVVVHAATDQLAAAARRLDGWARAEGGLGGRSDGRLVALLPGSDPLAVGARVRDLLAASVRTVGVAPLGTLPDDGADAFATAATVAGALGALGREQEVADAAALGSARFLLGHGSRADAARFVDDVVGPVLRRDADRDGDLARTVEAWCAAGGSATRAGRDLHVHANTVVQRLERVDALLGAGWREPDRLLDVRLALRMWRLGTLC